MAKRPIFIPIIDRKKDQLVQEVMVEFSWHKGMASSQKMKNVIEVHEAAREQDIKPILEVSTKSDNPLGISLSAFNLEIESAGIRMTLESAFQGSKVFRNGGPYSDLYGQEGRIIKKDERLKNSGCLISFRFEGQDWELEPKTAFYDWIYINALDNLHEMRSRLIDYAGFTDIEFNPKKSINCQARSCALYISLIKKNIIDRALKDKYFFLNLLREDSDFQPHSRNKQEEFFKCCPH